MTKIIAHRGDTSRYPENTLEAFMAAKEAGANGIELDVHMTSDGVLVVHHDYYLGHPDNGVGTIRDLHYSVIKKLTIENKYFIPTLQEVFDKLGKKLHYEIELKCFNIEAAKKVVALAEKYDVISCIEFTSPHPYLLPKLKEQHELIKIGYFTMPRPDWMDELLYRDVCVSQALLGNYNVLHLSSECITEEILDIVHEVGLILHAADCDDTKTLQHIKSLEVDQLTTNNLAAALA